MKFLKASIAAACCAAAWFPSLAHAAEGDESVSSRPLRQGFTLELGLGGALTHVSPERGESLTRFGLAPLSMSVGGFLSPDVALLARAAGTSYFREDAHGDLHQFVNGFYGGHVQFWVNDDIMLSGGPGLVLFGENTFLHTGTNDTEVGYGASFRAGFGVLSTKHHSLRFAVEVFPSKYKDAFVMGSALNFEWQYY
ncbi:hypothetical protein LZC95_03275 [Pendulispora brunnea]|uniref:Outer membrane protein beta-barrel domain-containing protein n=1 Tax=Pendulispora brunnea TaxID=2905690 RepID=A0ABZ2KB56_9BACT